MRKSIVGLSSALVVISAASMAEAKVKVFASVPEWAALATTVGGDRVEVTLATSALDNPEKMTPTPGMISALQAADLLLYTGGGLEDSWLPGTLERADNQKLAEGQPGRFAASEFVKLVKDETPLPGHPHTHFHNNGNPHIQGDPRNVQLIAGQLAKRLIDLDPEGKAYYSERAKAFIPDLKARIAELEKKAAPLRGTRVMVQHEHSLYLLKWLGIETATTVESEPGVEPGPKRLSKLIKEIPAEQIKFLIYGAYENPSTSKFVSENAGVPLVKVPVTVGGTDEAPDLFGLYDDAVQRLLDGLDGRERS